MIEAVTTTLAIDCGGSGIKGSVLDADAAMLRERIRVRTPYPLPPQRFLDVLSDVAGRLPVADRITVGMPGMIRHGIVVRTPHYVTQHGPHSAQDPELVAAWHGFDVAAQVTRTLGRPTLVLNDAEVHGAGVVRGRGLEVVLTLGTGLGCAVFDGGNLAPHLELSHAPVRRGVTYDRFIGDAARRELGEPDWSQRVRQVIDGLEPVFVWDRLYLGGGNAKRLTAQARAALAPQVELVPNSAGIRGGVRAWELLG